MGLALGQARQDLGLPARGHLLRRLGGHGQGQERGGQVEGRVRVDAADPAQTSGVTDARDELVSDEADPHGVPFRCRLRPRWERRPSLAFEGLRNKGSCLLLVKRGTSRGGRRRLGSRDHAHRASQ